MPKISLAAEVLWHLGGFPITNSLLATWIVMAILIAFSLAATRKLSLVPSTVQSVAELLVGGLYDFFQSVVGRHIAQFFPVVATLFIYILISNWVGLLPGVGTVGYFRTHEAAAVEAPAAEPKAEVAPTVAPAAHEKVLPQVTPEMAANKPESVAGESGTAVEKASEEPEFVPLLRAGTADLNMTLALALIAVLAMQFFGFQQLGHHYIGRFFNFKDPMNFFVGILELVSDVSKIISFAFRLFGNIFAGEVLLAVMAFLMPFIVPLPFLMMELFVGMIQALVFSMLSAAFFNMAVSHGEGEHS